MEKILNYLDKIKVDRSGGAWTTVSSMMADLELTREEIYATIMEAKDKDLVEILKTLEPGPYGLLSATITDQGRARTIFPMLGIIIMCEKILNI